MQPLKFNKGSDDAPFNMAQLFYMRLNELLAHKSKAKIYGDLDDWFNSLVEIHTQISFKLTDKENDHIIKVSNDIQKYLNSPMPINKTASRQLKSMINAKVSSLLQDLDRTLMRNMDRHKMIFPRIDTRTPMEAMRENLGLD